MKKENLKEKLVSFLFLLSSFLYPKAYQGRTMSSYVAKTIRAFKNTREMWSARSYGSCFLDFSCILKCLSFFRTKRAHGFASLNVTIFLELSCSRKRTLTPSHHKKFFSTSLAWHKRAKLKPNLTMNRARTIVHPNCGQTCFRRANWMLPSFPLCMKQQNCRRIGGGKMFYCSTNNLKIISHLTEKRLQKKYRKIFLFYFSVKHLSELSKIKCHRAVI